MDIFIYEMATIFNDNFKLNFKNLDDQYLYYVIFKF